MSRRIWTIFYFSRDAISPHEHIIKLGIGLHEAIVRLLKSYDADRAFLQMLLRWQQVRFISLEIGEVASAADLSTYTVANPDISTVCSLIARFEQSRLDNVCMP